MHSDKTCAWPCPYTGTNTHLHIIIYLNQQIGVNKVWRHLRPTMHIVTCRLVQFRHCLNKMSICECTACNWPVLYYSCPHYMFTGGHMGWWWWWWCSVRMAMRPFVKLLWSLCNLLLSNPFIIFSVPHCTHHCAILEYTSKHFMCVRYLSLIYHCQRCVN